MIEVVGIDWNKVTKGTKIIVQRTEKDEPFEAEFFGINYKGDISFFIKNENGRNILSGANIYTEKVSLAPQDDQEERVEFKCRNSSVQMANCDVCDKYDAILCPPVATQYRELCKLVQFCTFEPKQHTVVKDTEYTCTVCGYKPTHIDSIDLCPVCGSVSKLKFSKNVVMKYNDAINKYTLNELRLMSMKHLVK